MIGAFRNRFGEMCRPLAPERVFRSGQACRFAPPEGAYSPSSAKSRFAGKACQVVRVWNDSTVTVLFGDGVTLPVNSAYLKEVAP